MNKTRHEIKFNRENLKNNSDLLDVHQGKLRVVSGRVGSVRDQLQEIQEEKNTREGKSFSEKQEISGMNTSPGYDFLQSSTVMCVILIWSLIHPGI